MPPSKVDTPLVRYPDGHQAGDRIETIAQLPDLMPTMLEFFDIAIPGDVHARPLHVTVTEGASTDREHAITIRFPEGYGVSGIAVDEFDGWSVPNKLASRSQSLAIAGP